MTPRQGPKHFYVIVGLVAAGLLTAGWFAYATRSAKLNTLRTKLQAKQTELRNIEPEIARRPELEAEYAELQERLAVLEPNLPSYAYVPTLLRQLELLGNQTDNKIDAVKPQRAEPKPKAKTPEPGEETEGQQEAEPAKPPVPYDAVNIDVELEGTYWTAIRFLEHLQKFPKMIAVNEMNVRPTNTATTAASPDLKVQIAIKAVVTKGGPQWKSDTEN